MLSARWPAPGDAAGTFGDRPAATLFRFGKAARVQKQIFETDSQIQLALIKHGQNTDEQKRFPFIEPLNRSRRRESALTFVGLKVRGLTSAATRFRGEARLFLFGFNPSLIRS